MSRVHGGVAAYRFEQNLVNHFARCLRRGETPWGKVRLKFEFDYVGGFADVLALGDAGELIAFEAKLARWRDALHQAYRTRCFAHRSYVVLPVTTALIAGQYENEFRRRHVGLCSISRGNGVEIIFDVETSAPLQPWVATRAAAEFKSRSGTRAKCRLTQNSTRSLKQSARTEA